MSVINVAVSCSRFVDFSHKELKELLDVLYERQLVTRNVSGVSRLRIFTSAFARSTFSPLSTPAIKLPSLKLFSLLVLFPMQIRPLDANINRLGHVRNVFVNGPVTITLRYL